jgi:hypothetical protein
MMNFSVVPHEVLSLSMYDISPMGKSFEVIMNRKGINTEGIANALLSIKVLMVTPVNAACRTKSEIVSLPLTRV